MTLGEIIENYLTDKDLSQRQFAKLCGVSNGYISMLINNLNPATGKPLVPSLRLVMSIAHGMNMSLEDLISKIDDIKFDIPVDRDAISYRPTFPNSNIVSITKHTGESDKYILNDEQTNVVESMIKQMPKAEPIPISSTKRVRPVSQVAYGGKSNKSVRKNKRNTTIK